MNHLPRTESPELWPSAVSPCLLLGDVSGKTKATNFHRLSAIWNLVDFEFSIQPGVSLACSLGLCARNCLEFGTNNHLRNSWHHWLASVRQTLALHAEHAVGFMWSEIFIRSASCAARSVRDAVLPRSSTRMSQPQLKSLRAYQGLHLVAVRVWACNIHVHQPGGASSLVKRIVAKSRGSDPKIKDANLCDARIASWVAMGRALWPAEMLLWQKN